MFGCANGLFRDQIRPPGNDSLNHRTGDFLEAKWVGYRRIYRKRPQNTLTQLFSPAEFVAQPFERGRSLHPLPHRSVIASNGPPASPTTPSDRWRNSAAATDQRRRSRSRRHWPEVQLPPGPPLLRPRAPELGRLLGPPGGAGEFFGRGGVTGAREGPCGGGGGLVFVFWRVGFFLGQMCFVVFASFFEGCNILRQKAGLRIVIWTPNILSFC